MKTLNQILIQTQKIAVQTPNLIQRRKILILKKRRRNTKRRRRKTRGKASTDPRKKRGPKRSLQKTWSRKLQKP